MGVAFSWIYMYMFTGKGIDRIYTRMWCMSNYRGDWVNVYYIYILDLCVCSHLTTLLNVNVSVYYDKYDKVDDFGCA